MSLAMSLSLAEYALRQTTGWIDVTGPDGRRFWLRLRAVTQGDLIEAGADRLAALLPRAPDGAGEAQPAPSAETLRALAAFQESVVCAGVVGQSEDGETHTELRLVRDYARERGATAMHVSRLSAFGPGTVGRVATAILALSGMTEEAAAQLGSFRRG